MQPYEFFIGLRYTRAKRHNHFISFISMVSMLGIALGIAVLITVLSVMNGFQKEIRARMLGVMAHIQVNGFEEGLADWPAIAKDATRNPQVIAAAPYVNGQGLLNNPPGTPKGVAIRGVLPGVEEGVADLGRDMRAGKLEDLVPGGYGIVLGGELARALHATRGDKIQLIAPQGQITPAGMIPRVKTFTVVGMFMSGHYEYDLNMALIHLKDAQVLYRMGDNVSGVRLKVEKVDDAPLIARELAKTLRVDGLITDWTKLNPTYFKAVQLEKRMMFIILTLIIAVAAFNLVSTLVMVVTDKQAAIAILRTLGASPASIMKIFMVQGAVIGVTGTLLGVIGGVLLALNIEAVMAFFERVFHFQVLPREVYYLSALPSDLHWGDVGFVASIALVMALLATLYPSWRAARVDPAEALRSE